MTELHGGNIYKQFREGKKIKLDFSSNINPHGIENEFKKYLLENFDEVTKYPDPDYIALRENISRKIDFNVSNIIVGNGATEILFLFTKALKARKTLLVAPCFAEYERALNLIESEIDYFELKEKEDFILNINDLEVKLNNNNFDLLIICNPNNPTGKFIEIEKIKKINEICIKNKTFLFIDEAFIDFLKEHKNLTALKLNSENIFVMRALTKFFAIPGLRLGYGCTNNKDILEKMYKIKEPWSVNKTAELAGLFMLNDIEYINKTYLWLEEEIKFLESELKKIKNIEFYKTKVNFILIKLLYEKSNILKEKLIDEEILIRDASNFRFLDNSFIRIAVKDRESNKILIEFFKKYLGGIE